MPAPVRQAEPGRSRSTSFRRAGRHLVAAAADGRPQFDPSRSGRAPSPAIAVTSDRTTPPAAPRRPACAAPITPASGSAASTGTQSATSTASASPGTSVTSASVPGTGSRCGPVTAATAVPCTCCIQTSRSTGRSRAAARRARLAATAVGRSPTSTLRLNASNGGSEEPPFRSVIRRRTKAVIGPFSARAQISAPSLAPHCSAPHERGHVHVVVEIHRASATGRQRPARGLRRLPASDRAAAGRAPARAAGTPAAALRRPDDRCPRARSTPTGTGRSTPTRFPG